jgi:hypothetical protein
MVEVELETDEHLLFNFAGAPPCSGLTVPVAANNPGVELEKVLRLNVFKNFFFSFDISKRKTGIELLLSHF